MTYTEKHIVNTYTTLFEGLSPLSKIELIENLSKSLKLEKKIRDDKFFKSFGSFASTKSAEDICVDIKLNRKFRNKQIKF
jgi:hypothetical protein